MWDVAGGKIRTGWAAAAIATGSFLLASCDPPDQQRIVIPPGGQIQYNTSNFLYYSDDKYRVFLRKATDVNKDLEKIFEITPSAEFLLDPEVNHSTIVPKGQAVDGMLV